MPLDDYDRNEDMLFFLMFGNQKPVKVTLGAPTYSVEPQLTTEERLSVLLAEIDYALDTGNKEEFDKATKVYRELLSRNGGIK